MVRAAIIGCGKIADQHVAAIHRLEETQIVAVCDREMLMAKQLAERFGIAGCYADAAEMIKAAAPNVVHITTPPQSHYSLAKQCLEAGCHVYLEKPFTVTAKEADMLIALAEEHGLKITAGHNLQFTLEMLEMRRLVRDGFLGGKAVHVESHFPYGLEDPTYVGPVLGSRKHWVRQLPGQLLHNIVSHGISKLVEFLDEELDEIIATAHQSPRLKSLGGQEVLDELRVMIRDKSGTTAYFCFSTQIKPGINQLRIFGPKNSLLVDHGCGSTIRMRSGSQKSYLAYFVPPLNAAREHLRSSWVNFRNFLSQKLHQDSGMKELIGQFYESVQKSGEPPIPYREIRLTAKIMDEVFAQIYGGKEERRSQLETASA